MTQLLPERRRARIAERWGAPFAERWEPFRELEQVTERMRRMLDETFSGLGGWPSALLETAGWSPLVDLEEQDDAYVLEAELPGVKRGDVEIELIGNELAIGGELKEKERSGIVRRRARRSGRFDYRVTLPEQVEADQIEASLADGVLTVRVPKSERAQRKKIEIKGS
jgi:HSP20 family protein